MIINHTRKCIFSMRLRHLCQFAPWWRVVFFQYVPKMVNGYFYHLLLRTLKTALGSCLFTVYATGIWNYKLIIHFFIIFMVRLMKIVICRTECWPIIYHIKRQRTQAQHTWTNGYIVIGIFMMQCMDTFYAVSVALWLYVYWWDK